MPPIFSEYCSYLWEKQKTDTTVYAYLTTLLACLRTICRDYCFSNNIFFKSLRTEDIERYFDEKNGLGTKVLQRHWSTLNSFFSFLLEKEYISTNPMLQTSRPADNDVRRKLKYLSRNELERLISVIKQNPTRFAAFRDEVIIKLAVSTGLDIRDLLNINFDHIDFSTSTIRIINKKGERLIPFGKSMSMLLQKWGQFRAEYFKESDTPALFISSKKNRISADAVNNMLDKYCEKADITRITFKDLKSTMIYLLAQKNVSMEAIMEHLDVSDYMIVVQAYDAAMKEYNSDILCAIDSLFERASSSQDGNTSSCPRPIFSLHIDPPEYVTYQGGQHGFTIYGNISNLLNTPIRIKLSSCSVFTNGRLRASDYAYSGYQFSEEFIFPETTKTFGKIWITDSLQIKQLQSGDYLMLCLIDVCSKVEYHIKYVFQEQGKDSCWIESNWYEAHPM